MPAKNLPGERFADMMRRLINAGKGRTANKLRSNCRDLTIAAVTGFV